MKKLEKRGEDVVDCGWRAENMVKQKIAGCMIAALAVLTGGAEAATAKSMSAEEARLVARKGAAQRAAAQKVVFSDFVVATLRKDMPRNGGYDASKAATAKLSQAVMWNDTEKRLVITPKAARPVYCSGACYLLLVKTLQNWQAAGGGRLSAAAWRELAVYDVADGVGVWGRANANGPGFAKLVHDLKAGVNFNDIRLARPGDFLKFFWSAEIGAKEQGHLVVYLGHKVKGGKVYINYWSANKPDGFSVRTVDAATMHNLIFTRITAPQNFNNVTSLSEVDTWLQDMLRKSFTYAEVCKRVGLVKPPAKKKPAAR